jgi:hypothetical protein
MLAGLWYASHITVGEVTGCVCGVRGLSVFLEALRSKLDVTLFCPDACG